MRTARLWLRISLANLCIAALLGLTLRMAYVVEFNWMDFRHIVHTHSHLAMLGWVFSALMVLLLLKFLPVSTGFGRKYRVLFVLLFAAVWGMTLFFPFEGYDTGSITFAYLHIVFSYIFTYYFLRDLRKHGKSKSLSVLFAKTSLYWMVLSTLAIWALAPINILELRHTSLFYMAIQFFLHFQFNGWFLFAVVALLFRYMENHDIAPRPGEGKQFYWFLVVATLLTFTLAVTWAEPIPLLFWINSLGVVLQVVALFFFLRTVRHVHAGFSSIWSGIHRVPVAIAFAAFILKILIQAAVVVPYIATIGYTIRNFVIGFIHLMMLGMISCFLLGHSGQLKLLSFHRPLGKSGLWIFLAGFLLTEFILFGQGTLLWARMGFVPYYLEILAGATALLPAGLILIFAGQLRKSGSLVED